MAPSGFNNNEGYNTPADKGQEVKITSTRQSSSFSANPSSQLNQFRPANRNSKPAGRHNSESDVNPEYVSHQVNMSPEQRDFQESLGYNQQPTPSGRLGGQYEQNPQIQKPVPVTFSNEKNYSSPSAPAPPHNEAEPLQKEATGVLQQQNIYAQEQKMQQQQYPPPHQQHQQHQQPQQRPQEAAAKQSGSGDLARYYNELRKEAERARKDINELKERVIQLSSVKAQNRDGDAGDPFIDIPQKSELQASLEDLLGLQAQHSGSDMHLKVGAPPVVRIDGDLVPVGEQVLTSNDAKRLIIPIITAENRIKLAKGKEIDFSYQSAAGRFRVNAYLQRGFVSASFRLVNSSVGELSALGLPGSITQFMSMTSGLFIITGPTGSGKSTTLASMVDHLNKNTKFHIITIEDPIEFLFEDKNSILSQREVGIDTESFAEGMKAALRQDPDVIVLGELRDRDTTYQALKAAETGHLVISTMHSANAVQSIVRLADMFPPAERPVICATLADILCGILSQKLILSSNLEQRVLVPELLYVTPTIASLIRAGNFF